MRVYGDYCNTSPIIKSRNWLIKFLAGKSMIVLNAKLSIDNKANGCDVIFTGCSGGMISDSHFDQSNLSPDQAYKLEQYPEITIKHTLSARELRPKKRKKKSRS